jgi:hypothetical protein
MLNEFGYEFSSKCKRLSIYMNWMTGSAMRRLWLCKSERFGDFETVRWGKADLGLHGDELCSLKWAQYFNSLFH